MNSIELKAERIRKGFSAVEMGRAIGKTADAYIKKERGYTNVTAGEMVIISKKLELNENKFFVIFFDGVLPFCKN